MDVSTAVVLLLSVLVTHAEHTVLDWSDCGSDPSVNITEIAVTPMPVVVPGPIRLTVQGRLDRPIGDIEISLDIKRHTFLLDLPLPCLFNVGSCTQENTCARSLLDTMISEDWAGIMADIGSQVQTMLRATVPVLNTTACPVPATTIDIQQYTLNLPEVPSIISFFAEGDYSVDMTVKDKDTGHTLLCLRLGLTINEKEEPCTGLFCG